MSLSIKPVKSKNKNTEGLTSLMKQNVIPGYNSPSCLIIGPVKSGKSTLVCHMVNEFYSDFYEEKNRFLFSPTATYDPIADEMGIDEENRIDENMIEELTEIVEDQKDQIKSKGKANADKLLIIFDDITSCKALQRSKIFMKLFCTNRHFNCQVIAISHKYKNIPRTSRLQCGHVIMFNNSQSELDALCDDFCANGLNKKQFMTVINHALKKTDDNPKPFIYINLTADQKERYRKNFDTILELN